MRALAWAALVFAGSIVGLSSCDGDSESSPGGDAGSDVSAGDAADGDASAFTPLIEGDCDPLVPTHCGLPLPSNVWLRPDPSGNNPSGLSIRFGETTLPATGDGVHVPPSLFFEHDGWSASQPIITHFPNVSTQGCATPADIELSLGPGSPTVLLDVELMVRVPHWVDIDDSASPDQERMFIIRPAVRLRDGARYIVAIRRLVSATGVPIEPSPTFQALRDELPSDEYSVGARRELYADIFTRLDQAGVDRSELLLAWDFTTQTKAGLTRKLVALRDHALSVVGGSGPEFSVESVEENPNPELLRRIVVTMTVPNYLTAGGEFDPSGPIPRLVVDEQTGLPKQNGTMDQEVVILVPNSVLTPGKKHGLIQNGHGLFGTKFEGNGGYLARFANGFGWIAFATDFFGFAEPDVALAVKALTGDHEAMASFFERQMQGHVIQLLAMRMMMGRVAATGIEDPDSGELLLEPKWIDASVRGYRGDSQGGIMGAGYMALSTDVTRGLLGEPGQPYSLLLNRSVDWPKYGIFLNGTYESALNVQIMLSLIQLLWDKTEPGGLSAYVTSDTLPATPAHQLLLHVAIGDHQVSPFGAHVLARTLGAKLLSSNDPAKPHPRSIFGLEPANTPATGSFLVEYDFGLFDPLGNVPNTEGCDPHDRVRDLTPSHLQTDRFLRSGVADWYCDGICNCDGPGEEDRCAETFADQCE